MHTGKQALDLTVARVARTARPHESFRLETQALDHRVRVKIAMRNEHAQLSEALGHSGGRYAFHREADRGGARDVWRGTVEPNPRHRCELIPEHAHLRTRTGVQFDKR